MSIQVFRLPLLLALLAFGAFAAFAAPEYRKIRAVTAADGVMPGKFNLSPGAVASTNGTYADPPWSAHSAQSASPPPPSSALVNTSPDRGWMSANFDTIDPENPYLQLDFPYPQPVKFDSIGLLYTLKRSREYRPSYVIERRLAGEWEEIFRARTLEEATNPLIQFDAPIEADAVRVRFFEPSPQNAWWIERFWVYADEAPAHDSGGGQITFSLPEIEREYPVWKPKELSGGAAPEIEVHLQAPESATPRQAQLTLSVTDYYRRPLKEVVPTTQRIELAQNLSLRMPIPTNLQPGAYFLEAEVGDGERVFERSRFLFGIAASEEEPVRAAKESLVPPPSLEIAGAVGQYDGLEQRKSRHTVDAFLDSGFNTMQLEMFWRDLEPLPGVYNFQELDELVQYIAAKDKFFNITLYFADDQAPEWLRNDEYKMRDQYGQGATGRNFWKMKFFSPPSVYSPLFKEHFAELWARLAARYGDTGRMLRCDIRPPLLEVFFFDEYTNLYVNKGKTDNVWDYSEWSRLAFIDYLRDYRKFTLDEVNARHGTAWQEWRELQLPPPAPLAERAKDTRPAWLDFIDFKVVYTQQEFYLNVIRAVEAVRPGMKYFASEAQIDDSPLGRELAKYADAGKLYFGNFSIEHGREYFQYDQYRFQPKPVCFEWGDPAPAFLNYTAGLFSILPLLPHGTVRWVGAPIGTPEPYANAKTYASWQDFTQLNRKLPEVARFNLIADSEIAVIGGFVHDNAHYENNRPVRRVRQSTEWDRYIVNNWGGLAGVLKAANYYNGLPPYYELTALTPPEKLRPVKLYIDGGHPDIPESVQRQALEFVQSGGKLLLWGTSFLRDGDTPTESVRQTFGIESAPWPFSEEVVPFTMTVPGGKEFSAKLYRVGDHQVPNGEVIGRSADGKPMVWRIRSGAGEVLFFAGLPVLEAADQWTPWMRDIQHYTGIASAHSVEMRTKFPLPNLLTYALREPETGRILVVLYNYTSEPVNAVVRYRDLPVEADWQTSVYHAAKAGTQLRGSELTPQESAFEVLIMPLDLQILEIAPPQAE